MVVRAHPSAKLARWAARDWETQPGGIDVNVRYYHPNLVEMRCSAENGVITFSADGRVVPIPVAPFQLRQESIIDPVDRFLTEELGRDSLTDTLHRIADASHRAALAEHQHHDDAPRLRKAIADSDTKIAQYRATLDAGGDPTLVAGWISETMAVRNAAQARLGLTEAPPERMSEEQLAAIVDAFGGLLGVLRRADQDDRAEIYTRIGLQMTYRPGTETVLAEVRSNDLDRVPVMCPELNTRDKHTVIAVKELAVSE
jgi:hypothetical protein